MPRMPKIYTFNACMVGVQGDCVVMLRPPQPGALLSKEQALQLAAWIVCLADMPAEDEDPEYKRPAHGRTRFLEILEAVELT